MLKGLISYIMHHISSHVNHSKLAVTTALWTMSSAEVGTYCKQEDVPLDTSSVLFSYKIQSIHIISIEGRLVALIYSLLTQCQKGGGVTVLKAGRKRFACTNIAKFVFP